MALIEFTKLTSRQITSARYQRRPNFEYQAPERPWIVSKTWQNDSQQLPIKHTVILKCDVDGTMTETKTQQWLGTGKVKVFERSWDIRLDGVIETREFNQRISKGYQVIK